MLSSERYFRNPNGSRYWSPGDVSLLRRQWEDGVDAEIIATQLRRSYTAVVAKAMRLRLRRLRRKDAWSAASVASLKAYWAQGFSASQIARLLKDSYSRCAVIGKARRLDLDRRTPANQKSRKFAPCRKSPVRKQKPMPVFVRPIRPDPEPGDRVPFLELEPHHCRWPLWEDGEPHVFCGRNKIRGESYCEDHQRRAWTTTKSKGTGFKFKARAA